MCSLFLAQPNANIILSNTAQIIRMLTTWYLNNRYRTNKQNATNISNMQPNLYKHLLFIGKLL